MRNNNILVIGRVTFDLGLSKSPDGTDIYRFEVAVTDPGENPEKFTFHCIGPIAITASKVAKEGKSVTVHGHCKFSDFAQWVFFADSVGLNMLHHIDNQQP